VLHYLHDVLGSVVALTNSVGQVVERYDYDPYGTTTIMDAAAVPLALKPIDPAAADGYYHDHDRDRDIDAADYTDLMDCVNNTPYDPMCIYTHDRTGDRRVDIVDVGVYLAYADDQGLAGGTSAPELVHYGRPLRLQFDADGDGRVDMFDWYAMQTCFTKNTTRCNYLFDDNGDGVVNFYDLPNFKQAADGPQGGPGATQWRRKLVASRYGNPFMWTGQRYDATTGQYHFWARTYSPRLGRWMQRDPLEYVDGVNLYVYASSSPLISTDPLGLWELGYTGLPGSNDYIKTEITSAGDAGKHPGHAATRRDERRQRDRTRRRLLGGDLVSDGAGRAIVLHYLYGDGRPVHIINNPIWTNYMMRGPGMAERIRVMVQAMMQSLRNSGRYGGVYSQNMVWINPEWMGEGIIGYHYLGRTSNLRITIYMTRVYIPYHGWMWYYNVHMQWIDVMDPNPEFTSDTLKDLIARGLSVGNRKVYDMTVEWWIDGFQCFP
jgi:RHS repeat-associated protein